VGSGSPRPIFICCPEPTRLAKAPGGGDVRSNHGIAQSQRLVSCFTDREPAEHLEQRIYDGFPNRADQSLMDQFHRTDWQGRRKIAERLSDQRVREYARRLIYMEAPEILSDGARAEMDAWIRDRVLNEDTKVPWNTIPKAMRENDELLAKATDNEAALLTDVRRFLTEMADST